MTTPRPAHFFLEDGTDLGDGWVEKLDSGDLQVRVSFAGEDKIIALGGAVGLSARGHNEPDTYTLIGVMFGFTPFSEEK